MCRRIGVYVAIYQTKFTNLVRGTIVNAAEEDQPAEARPDDDTGPGAETSTAVRTWLTTAPLWQVGVAALVVAAVAAEIFGSGIGRVVGAPMEAPQGFGEDEAKDLPFGSFILATFMSGGIGVLLALLVAWKASRPTRLWVIIALIGTILSFVSPITAEDTTTATKVILSLSHVVVAAIVIPLVGLRLSELERQRSAEAAPASEPA